MPCNAVLASGAVGILGTTIGAFVTYQFSKRAQREQWMRDAKKQEYRELLSTLTEAYGMICVLQQPGRLLEPEDQRRLEEIHLKALKTIRDRLLIDDDIDGDRILNLWTTATERFQQDLFYIEFRNRFNEIHSIISKAAKEKL